MLLSEIIILKIQGISNFYNILKINNTPSETNKINQTNPFKIRNSLNADVVSFSAKKYDADSIINPTNHCAYCGCKVYTDDQLTSIAKEMLSSKAYRLQGKIKSVLEKLEGAKYSQEIAVAKRLENADQINFFKNFLDISSKKSFLRGDAIFQQVYSLSSDEALELLVENLHPLQRTIDHISPQNLAQDNNSADINLVEACYCCNHDLKKGSSFEEFYTMFPSIKNNMPEDKFQFAVSKLLDSSKSDILQRLSASNMLKLLERLFIQRTEASNYLDSIDFRIKNSKNDILSSIGSCKDEISQKRKEISELENQYESLRQDSEYVALLTRLNYQSQLDSLHDIIQSLREKRQKTSNAINDIKNPKRSQNKKRDELTPEQKKARIDDLKAQLNNLSSQLDSHLQKEAELTSKIKELDSKFPTIEMLQREKNNLSRLIEKHNRLKAVLSEIASLNDNYSKLNTVETQLNTELSSIVISGIDIESCTEEERKQYERFLSLIDSLKYIEEHPNGGAIKVLINTSAKIQINSELESLKDNPLVIEHRAKEKYASISSILESTKKQIESIEKQIDTLEQEKQSLSVECSEISQSEAKSKLVQVSAQIRNLVEKSNYLKIPQLINTLKAEIALLESTINDLQDKKAQIESMYESGT